MNEQHFFRTSKKELQTGKLEQGISGYSGYPGADGISGYSGETGATGPQGISGYSGKNAEGREFEFEIEDWEGPDDGLYSIVFDHDMSTMNLSYQAWEKIPFDETEIERFTLLENVEKINDNQIKIYVPATPDWRFRGRIVISGTSGTSGISMTGVSGVRRIWTYFLT